MLDYLDFGTLIVKDLFISCGYSDCEINQKYVNMAKQIKEGTVAGFIGIEKQMRIYYCRDCIPKVMADLRKELDPTLWAFK